MIRKEKEGVHWLEFELFQDIPGMVHAVFLRHGGYSKGQFASFNLSYHLGDDREYVKANLDKAKRLLGIERFFWGNQVHGAKVETVDRQMKHIPECDGLATKSTSMGLMIHHADCQAAIFCDPVERVIAAAHSGWRGSVANIYSNLIAHMQKTSGSKSENLLVGISPSLGPQSAQFINYKTELPEFFWQYQVKPLYFDFWAISKQQLIDCGISPHHIEIAGIDTMSCPEDYYSYRYAKVRGGHGTVVAWT